MIEKETIDTIKQGVDLVTLIQSKGISLKKNGRSYFGLCPFHNDTNPSPFSKSNRESMAVLWLWQRRRCDPIFGDV